MIRRGVGYRKNWSSVEDGPGQPSAAQEDEPDTEQPPRMDDAGFPGGGMVGRSMDSHGMSEREPWIERASAQGLVRPDPCHKRVR